VLKNYISTTELATPLTRQRPGTALFYAGLSRIFHYEADQICGNKLTDSALTAREVAPNSDRNFDVAVPQQVGRRISESSMSISSEAGRWLIMNKANGETYPIPVSYSPAFTRVA